MTIKFDIKDPAANLVTDGRALASVLDQLRAAPRYALDTEFHREKSYWPFLALIQVAWDEPSPGLALIDPLAVDVAPLREVLEGPGLMVAHAADQDLDVLRRSCGVLPAHLYDTQIAGGFVGFPSASLASLTQSILDISLAKGDRLTDWRARPLTSSQLVYAAADVQHLLRLTDSLDHRLRSRGREQWVQEECELLRVRHLTPSDPRVAWWKIKDARRLRSPNRGVAQAAAGWRELRAREVDLPSRQVLPDLVLQAIASRPPRSLEAIRNLRGMEPRYLRSGAAESLLAAIQEGAKLSDAEIVNPSSDDVSSELRPAVALIMAWLAQVARNEGVDLALMATRSDVTTLIRGDLESRLSRGWRRELVGGAVEALVEGRASIAFDGSRNLLLEDRSGSGSGS